MTKAERQTFIPLKAHCTDGGPRCGIAHAAADHSVPGNGIQQGKHYIIMDQKGRLRRQGDAVHRAGGLEPFGSFSNRPCAFSGV